MKLGVITDCFNKTHADGIGFASELKLDGVQIYATTGDFSPELSLEQKAEYKRLLQEKGLVVSALCGDMGGYGFELEADNAERIEKTKKIIDLAVEFGTKVVTTHIGVIPSASRAAAGWWRRLWGLPVLSAAIWRSSPQIVRCSRWQGFPHGNTPQAEQRSRWHNSENLSAWRYPYSFLFFFSCFTRRPATSTSSSTYKEASSKQKPVIRFIVMSCLFAR